MEDRSLDDFLDAGEDADERAERDDDPSGADASSDDGPSDDPGQDAEPAVSPDDVDPASSTYVLDPGGGACAACGETVERRWRDEAGLVCPACKEW